ncbi:MAG: NADH-quinone oxidoreductase subunit H, partial [Phycisphaerales bacterium]|nr:NADH-quinone oxidoreductase subunit H [Phycisphaerales bacterium]
MDLAKIITAQFVVSFVVINVMLQVVLLTVAYSIYLERKISAYIQDRLGPNRVGFDFGLPFLKFLRGCLGLGQPMADGLKFLLKEDYAPSRVDKYLFTIAPMASFIPALIGFIIIPWGGVWICPDFSLPFVGRIEGGPVHVAGFVANVGIIYILAVASLGVYGVTLGGWASNNKYSFLGGLRCTAQMISYEVPLGVSLLAALLLMGTVMPDGIIRYQAENGWLLFSQPIAAFIFFTAILAEANRAPFDNAEAEQELVGGYHTEYSSMRFALFFLAEYAHMVTSSSFFVLLFFGGYHLPLGVLGIENHWLSPENTTLIAVLAKMTVFLSKVVLIICFQMLIRWTLPRLRYDQVMMLGWQSLIPISLVVVVVTSIMVYLGQTPADYADSIKGFGWLPLLMVNLVVMFGVYIVQNTLPRSTSNRRIALYGSRYNPMPGELVSTAPVDPMALEDRPAQGTV